MPIQIMNARRGLCRIAPAIAFAMLLMAPDYALAADMRDCPVEIQHLDTLFPEGVSDEWVERLQNDLGAVNAVNDMQGLEQAQEERSTELQVTWRGLSTYLENPENRDQDNGELVIFRDRIQGQLYLVSCLFAKRAGEINNAEEGQSQAEAESESMYADSREAPPTRIAASEPWFIYGDYPPLAVRQEREGKASYELTIGADGNVLACQASGPPNSADLEMATCNAILARARFNPATDRAGNPVVGEYAGSMTWKLTD